MKHAHDIPELMQAAAEQVDHDHQADDSKKPRAFRVPVTSPHPGSASMPRGLDLIQDIRREMHDFAPAVIFDVGANVGDRAREFASEFPGALVYCFEPVATTFDKLEKRLAGIAGCRCFPIGFGAERAEVSMLSHLAHSNRSHVVLERREATAKAPSTAIVPARLETVDHFCQEEGIEEIDLLKIDTEGFDLNVLQGARSMLGQRRIRFILAEAGMYPGNTRHVPFMELWSYLTGLGYVLFGIYDQCREWTKDLPYLRRADLAFIRQ